MNFHKLVFSSSLSFKLAKNLSPKQLSHICPDRQGEIQSQKKKKNNNNLVIHRVKPLKTCEKRARGKFLLAVDSCDIYNVVFVQENLKTDTFLT